MASHYGTVPADQVRAPPNASPSHLPWTWRCVLCYVPVAHPNGGYIQTWGASSSVLPTPATTHVILLPPTSTYRINNTLIVKFLSPNKPPHAPHSNPPTLTPQVEVDLPSPSNPGAGKSSRSFVTDHLRPLMLASLAVLVLCGVMSTTVARGESLIRVLSLKQEDVHTNDRCIVYTYFDTFNVNRTAEQTPIVHAWYDIWSQAGWKPVVLNDEHARQHPEYAKMRKRFAQYPTTNAAGYELACYLRYLALATVGGGYMTDYDTLNVNVPPPPQCSYLPNEGKLTTHDDYVPAMVSGTGEEFDRFAHEMFHVDVDEAMAVTGESMVSDMILLQFFGQKKFCGDYCTVDTTTSFYTSPSWVSDPPCDATGNELPLLFHMSTNLMVNTLGTGDKAATMRWWREKLSEAKQGCNPVSVSTDEEYAQKYLTMPGVNKFTDALKMHWECGHHECAPTKEMRAMVKTIGAAKDKDGNRIFRR